MPILEETSTGYRLVRLLEEDAPAALRIFNEHAATGFAAYMEEPAPATFITGLLRSAQGYPALAAETQAGEMVGFGLLRPYSPVPAFSETAVTTIFLAREHTRQGIGSAMLARMLQEAEALGITRILAHISSENTDSICFHKAHGFEVCGQFPSVGKKWDRPFDVVWMVKPLSLSDE